MSEQEFTQKVMVYSSKFYGYSYKILGTQEDARDTVQDLYVKLWSLRHTLVNINNIEAFATTIVRNLCLDRLKKVKNIVVHNDQYGKELEKHDYNSFESNGSDHDLKIELVRNAIKKIPEIQQKVFIMRDFEEKEFDLISLELGISPENVRVVLSRARKRVRELIDKKEIL